ncbi:hypothetical protein [Planktothrix mougeotii]|uniref:Outer membrane protein beta-barrel domain-containing protein n=1 Tax=Planktothrix mougeotii LEGE 06226 TaxID=1828728 RepID=A0ABR9U7K7_9CYAN|nr:hypothetical protein [Planktothrix mougeotii]MBE9142446.1 hypothetical protein [Planktothrix mougeotii LEGE 06226]
MPNLHTTAFIGTAIALTLNGGELLAQELSSPSSLQNIVGSSVEIASKTLSETTDSNPEQLAVESTELNNNSEEVIQQQPQTLSEAKTTFPSTQAADLSNNWMERVEWNIAQNSDQSLPVTQQPEAREEKPEDPRKAADANGRRLSNNYNYVGLGGNIGITGDGSGLGGGGLMSLSKTGFSENFSLHSGGIIIGSDSASLVHLTADFPVRSETNAVRFSPFVGAGIIYKDIFNNDFSVGPSAVAGIDIPISYSFLITGRASVGYIRDETDFGIQIGFSYIYTKGLLGLIFD